MRRSKFSPQQIASILKEFDNGRSVDEISREHGVSPATFYKWRSRYADGTPKTERQIQLEKQFSAWDGSHIELTKLIKKAMNDPGSYEHVETVYWDMKDHIVVRTTYSGKNAFGGRVKNWVKAKADNNGNIIEIIEEGN